MRLSTTTLSTISVCAITLSTLPALAVPVQDVHAHQHISDLWKRASSVVTRSVMTTKSKSYDYIIVGGGLAGLTVAGRLSEDPNVSVLVLETGDDDRTDSRITDVGNYGQAFGTNLDWAFKTVGSSAYGAKTIRGGKTLGGSTSINGAAWTRGSAAQYDAIGQLGNDGWSWDDLLRYMNKAESFTKPNSDQAAAGAKFVEGAHGYGGPIQVRASASGRFLLFVFPCFPNRAHTLLLASPSQFAGASQTEFTPVNTNSKRDAAALDKRMYTGPQQPAFESAFMTALGLQSLDDLAAGEANGVAYTINNIAQDGTRSSSAAGYITPVEYTRPNLRVLVSWRGSQLLWDANSATPRATGVRVQRAQGGNTYDLTANKEVIIAAGAINSPAFLERSGVGSAKVLKAARVAHKVDLPSVGANLVEQTMDTLGAPTSVDFGGRGPSNLIAMPNINQIMTNGSATRTWIESNYQTWANEAVQAGAAVSTDALIAQWKLQTTAIFEHKAPVVEMFADSGFPNGGLGECRDSSNPNTERTR